MKKPEREIWKSIPEWPWYEASSSGRIKSYAPMGSTKKAKSDRPRILKPGNTNGYQVVVLHDVKQPQQGFYVHVLVLLTFRGPAPSGHETRHLNDIKQDCRLSNLCWGTKSENRYDAVRNGKHGAKKQAAKLRGRRISTDVLARRVIRRGWHHKEETIQLLREQKLGHKQSVETRAKRRAAHLKFWKNKRRGN